MFLGNKNPVMAIHYWLYRPIIKMFSNYKKKFRNLIKENKPIITVPNSLLGKRQPGKLIKLRPNSTHYPKVKGPVLYAKSVAIKATCSCFSQSMPHSGICILLSSAKGSILGMKVPIEDPVSKTDT
jgi:hypothetical protein